ncbi:MAG: hypothetical protein IJD35_07575 [Clostridia bacterium]|nr:hypothetical protein [Clostridia bacterium]
MKKLIFLMMLLGILLLTVACAEESVTTVPTTTKTPIETTPAQTTIVTTKPIVTSTPVETTTPETTPAPAWMAKIENGFYEKAVEEDGKYYIYLTYNFGDGIYAVNDNQTFVEAYVANEKDIVFANLDRGHVSEGIYLRATAEEIEAYAKNSYVTGIYSYAQDKVVEGCKANIVRLDALFNPYALREIAEENVGGSLPMVKIESKEELAACIDACVPTPDESYHSRWMLNQMAAGYDDAFFAQKTLFFLGAEAGTGSARFSFVHALADEAFTIVIDRSTPWMMTTDMAHWAILIEVDNSAIENQTKFISVLE